MPTPSSSRRTRSYARSSKRVFYAIDPQQIDRDALTAIGVLCGEQEGTGRVIISLEDWMKARAHGVRVPELPTKLTHGREISELHLTE